MGKSDCMSPEAKLSEAKLSEIEFSEVSDPSSDEFKEAMKIYTASFPENERRTVASIEAMVNDGKIRLIVGLVDGRASFMALLYPIEGTPFVLGDYLATAKEYRGKGIGKQFLDGIFSAVDGLEFDYFLIQVENPYISSDETMRRRVEFYKRLGMKELKGLRYVLPPLQGTMPTEMILMVLTKADDHHLDGEVMGEIIFRIFRELDGRHEDDEFLISTLRGVPDLIDLA